MILDMGMEWKLSRLDDTMALDKPTMRPRALPSRMLCSVFPSLSRNDQP